jgi:hypothetical protein
LFCLIIEVNPFCVLRVANQLTTGIVVFWHHLA